MDEKQAKQFHFRTWVVVVLLVGMLLALGSSMYQTQIVHGAEYAAQSRQKIANTESVSASRGEIADTNGQVLVTNRIGYQVTLDTSRMGNTESRNAILLELMSICIEDGVEWNDSLPISMEPPFVFTTNRAFYYSSTDEEGNTVEHTTRLYALSKTMRWIQEDEDGKVAVMPTAEQLLGKMCASFDISGEGAVNPKTAAPEDVPALNIGDMDPRLARAAVGVLYELYLRSKDLYRVEYIFAGDVSLDFIAKVKERSLAGVNIQPTSIRQYGTDYAAHILGRVALMDANEWEYYKTVDLDGDGTADYQQNNSVGKEGIEKAFESYLRGTSGVRSVELNTNGKIVREEWLKEPSPGANVILTLDIGLQRSVEDILARRIPELPSENTQGAAAVVIGVHDGSVLAMASYPTYQLSTYAADLAENSQNPLNPYLNRATMGAYPPGSTFKMAVGIAGLEEGEITPKTKILDTGTYDYYGPNGPACWLWRRSRRTHGEQTVSQAITNSCNVFFYDLGRRLGIENLQKYAALFGLGEPTGIEIPERTGVMAGPEYTASQGQTWYEGNTLSVAIGQESSQFTPLQLANYVATLVNGGTHYQAHLLKEIVSSDYSQILYEHEPTVLSTIEIQEKNLAAVKEGMLALTQTGSLRNYFRDLDVKVGAKTGSAQLSAASDQSNAVLVCFAPYDDPQIAIAIVAEKGGSGSELGAIAADILRYYFAEEPVIEAVAGENQLIR